jgi:hypothetical protein
MTRSIILFSWISIFLISLSFANQTNDISQDCTVSLEQIISNRSSCVREITGNKIYLQPNCLNISENGIYLILNENGDVGYLPELFSDKSGCFLHTFSFDHNSTARYHYEVRKPCPGCGQLYFIYCKNPACPLKQKK